MHSPSLGHTDLPPRICTHAHTHSSIRPDNSFSGKNAYCLRLQAAVSGKTAKKPADARTVGKNGKQ
eukprot:4711834-Pleurochrysis_carterae.AAC.1